MNEKVSVKAQNTWQLHLIQYSRHSCNWTFWSSVILKWAAKTLYFKITLDLGDNSFPFQWAEFKVTLIREAAWQVNTTTFLKNLLLLLIVEYFIDWFFKRSINLCSKYIVQLTWNCWVNSSLYTKSLWLAQSNLKFP